MSRTATHRPALPRLLRGATVLWLGLLLLGGQAAAGSILFIGNSFTFAWGSPVRFYRADSVTDLNNQGTGGVPALFKSFTTQAGLNYDVYLETQGGAGIDWHVEHKLGVIGQRPWDTVVMHGYSTLDPKQPGDATALVRSVQHMAEFLRGKNPTVDLRLMATWPRADQTYQAGGAWFGKPIEAMARDVRLGYDRAAAATPAVSGVVPVGEAWVRAMQTGVASANPYDGVAAGQLNLWSYDHYHASSHGYYLEALVLFGSLTGRDPRSLGARECSGFELGLSPAQVQALQQVAFDQLASQGTMRAAPLITTASMEPMACARTR
jgi:hypothetical protein